jgi:hypothetical protein
VRTDDVAREGGVERRASGRLLELAERAADGGDVLLVVAGKKTLDDGPARQSLRGGPRRASCSRRSSRLASVASRPARAAVPSTSCRQHAGGASASPAIA